MKLSTDPRLPILGGPDHERSMYQRLYALFRQIINVINSHADEIVTAFGVGQSPIDETASRVFGATYTNNTPKPILVRVSALTTASAAVISATVATVVSAGAYGPATATTIGIEFTVMPGESYSVSGTSVALTHWIEVR